MEQKNNNSISFDNLGIAERLLNCLSKNGFVTPTPIQHQAIPVALQGKDLVGIAQTGTGKTLAFGVPMLQQIASLKGKGLVLLPTRELAVQVEESLHRLGQDFGLRTAVLIGGDSMGKQLSALKRNPHIIIATPGRLNDHLDRRTVDLSDVRVLVLDEADLMFDMGFLPQIEKIIEKTPKSRQTMLFSATMPDEIIRLAKKHLQSPLRIEVAFAGKTADGVDQEIIVIKKEDRFEYLEKLLNENDGSVLVFCRTKRGVHAITAKLKKLDFPAGEIHSDRSQAQRQQALNAFKQGKIRMLIATDIAARGIDVSGIQLVVNYDLPEDKADYVHRIGRTARAGATGKAVSFAFPDQMSDIREIERLIKKSIPTTKLARPTSEGYPAVRTEGRFPSRTKKVFGKSRHDDGFGKRLNSREDRGFDRKKERGEDRFNKSGNGARARRPKTSQSEDDILLNPERFLFTDRDRFRAAAFVGRQEHYRSFKSGKGPRRSAKPGRRFAK
jgi:superfamily II DNA/RNA helicase